MTVLLGLLVTGVVFSLASAISGIQSIYTDQTGTVITYWHGHGRLIALAYAAALALAFCGIYRQYPICWKLGFVVLWLGAADFIFQAWRLLLPQPYGWVGATAVTIVTPFVALYWANWWRRQKGWFIGRGDERV
jgi:hypothetical protein